MSDSSTSAHFVNLSALCNSRSTVALEFTRRVGLRHTSRKSALAFLRAAAFDAGVSAIDCYRRRISMKSGGKINVRSLLRKALGVLHQKTKSKRGRSSATEAIERL